MVAPVPAGWRITKRQLPMGWRFLISRQGLERRSQVEVANDGAVGEHLHLGQVAGQEPQPGGSRAAPHQLQHQRLEDSFGSNHGEVGGSRANALDEAETGDHHQHLAHTGGCQQALSLRRGALAVEQPEAAFRGCWVVRWKRRHGAVNDSAVLSPSAEKVAAELRRRGFELEVVELPESARTAAEAAAAVGCEVAAIAKSLLFRAAGGRPIQVIASGANRVDEERVGELLGEEIGRADPDFVRTSTGFAIGGVPPVGHVVQPVVFIDEDLLALDTLWAAAGTPRSVFQVTPAQLVELTGGRIAVLKT
jgi:prolyl-tRNA editing enzyme YbaK/EbsC (Cys-tRNA(Pro) deacylase)